MRDPSWPWVVAVEAIDLYTWQVRLCRHILHFPHNSKPPFTLNILPNASLSSPSPAILVRRHSGTPEHRSSRSSISELSVCFYLIIIPSITSRSRRPSLPRAFHGLRRSHHCSSLGLLIPDRSHVMAAI